MCICVKNLFWERLNIRKKNYSLGFVDAHRFFGKIKKRTNGETMRNIFWNKFEIYFKVAKRFSGWPESDSRKEWKNVRSITIYFGWMSSLVVLPTSSIMLQNKPTPRTDWTWHCKECRRPRPSLTSLQSYYLWQQPLSSPFYFRWHPPFPRVFQAVAIMKHYVFGHTLRRGNGECSPVPIAVATSPLPRDARPPSAAVQVMAYKELMGRYHHRSNRHRNA